MSGPNTVLFKYHTICYMLRSIWPSRGCWQE